VSTEKRLFWRAAQALAQILTRLLFALKVQGRENIPRRGGALIVSNHQSNLDPVVMAAFLERPLNFVGKSELFGNRIAAWFMRWLNAFPIRQGKGDVGALKETIHRLREGHMLNIFPEGSRSPDGEIHAFQRGVALIIRRTKAPVIPAVIVGSYKAWPIHRCIWRASPIRVKFGRPMNLDGLESDEEITAAIETEVRRMFAEIERRPAEKREIESGKILNGRKRADRDWIKTGKAQIGSPLAY
jgi:1-acyl-sn-glycerol-3-phosphate acyltransferase